MLLRAQLKCLFRQACAVQVRNTYIFRHHFPPEKTPEGQPQRSPELQSYQKYDIIAEPADFQLRPVTVILLEDVEGVGHQFDILEVDSDKARDELVLPKKAVYASPFDLEYYGALKERMKEELESRIRVPFEYVKIGRKLQSMFVPIHVSMDHQWKIDNSIVAASLLESGIEAKARDVYIPKKSELSGPNFDLEAALLRFYVVVNYQYVIPMVGRISHISADDTRQSFYPESINAPTSDQLQKFGIREERPYYHSSAELRDGFNVVKLMEERAN